MKWANTIQVRFYHTPVYTSVSAQDEFPNVLQRPYVEFLVK